MADYTIEVRANTRQAGANIDRFRNKLRGVDTAAAAATTRLRTMVGVVTAALAGGGALRAIASFQDAMAQVGVVTGASTNQLNQMRQAVRYLGRDTRFSATEAAQGMLAIARTGLEADQAVEALTPTLELAQAAMIGVDEAARIGITTLQSFGLGIQDLETVMDTLVGTANRSSTDVRQLGLAMRDGAPAARLFGVDLQTTSAALGILANNGIRGARAGVALRNIFTRLTNPVGQAREELARVGLSLGDVDIRTRGIVPVLETLRRSGVDAFRLIGQEAGGALSILLNESTGLPALRDAIAGATGETSAASQALGATLGGSLDRVGSAVADLVLAIGEGPGGKGLAEILDDLATGINRVAEAADRFTLPALTIAIVAAGAALSFFRSTIGGLVRLLTGTFLYAVTGVAASFRLLGRLAGKGLVTAIAATIRHFRLAAGSFGTLAISARLLQGAFLAITSLVAVRFVAGIGAAIGVLGGVGAGLIGAIYAAAGALVYRLIEAFNETDAAQRSWIENTGRAFGRWATDVINVFGTVSQFIRNALTAAFNLDFEGLKRAFAVALPRAWSSSGPISSKGIETGEPVCGMRSSSLSMRPRPWSLSRIFSASMPARPSPSIRQALIQPSRRSNSLPRPNAANVSFWNPCGTRSTYSLSGSAISKCCSRTRRSRSIHTSAHLRTPERSLRMQPALRLSMTMRWPIYAIVSMRHERHLRTWSSRFMKLTTSVSVRSWGASMRDRLGSPPADLAE